MNTASRIELQLTVSDKGSPIKHTGQKRFTLSILTETDSNTSLIKSINNNYDYESDPTDVRLRDHIEHHLNDYHSGQYYFSKSIYKVFISFIRS